MAYALPTWRSHSRSRWLWARPAAQPRLNRGLAVPPSRSFGEGLFASEWPTTVRYFGDSGLTYAASREIVRDLVVTLIP